MMTTIKTYVTLFSATIIIAGSSCKKDKHSILPGQKVTVTTIAGDGSGAFADGPVLSAKFHSPCDVAVAADGTIYVADYNDHRIRKISGGQVTTLAGNGTFGIVNDNGGLAEFKNPYRIVVDAAGNVFVLDQVDTRIRKISTTAYVSTYAGTDQPGFLNGASLQARFEINAEGLAVDAQGNIYLDDTFNERIRKISTAAEVTTMAGSGAEGSDNGDAANAQFKFPQGIAADAQGNIYVADAGNLSIRKITAAGIVSKLAGSGIKGTADGDAGSAQFSSIDDIVADGQGNLYVTDENRIRKITAQGVVSTIAGSVAGYEDGDGNKAKFKTPGGLGIDAQGNVYVADINNNRIRKISFQ